MAGRAWYTGTVSMEFEMWARRFDGARWIADYLGGIADPLDGSHDMSFTYLPIVYEDDFQVNVAGFQFHAFDEPHYIVKVRFL